MRKFTSFLALLVIAFALPDKVKAWDYSAHDDPWKIVLKLENYDGMKMNQIDGGWQSDEFIAKSSDIRFQTDIYYGDKSQNNFFTIGNGENSASPNSGWTITYNQGSDWYKLSGLTI